MPAVIVALLATLVVAGCGGSSKSAPTQTVTVTPATQGTNPLVPKPIETGSEANKEATEEAAKKSEESKEASEEAGEKSEEAKKAAEEAKEAAEEKH
jgi:hypothetical protein